MQPTVIHGSKSTDNVSGEQPPNQNPPIPALESLHWLTKIKRAGCVVFSKIANLFRSIGDLARFNQYEYIPPRNGTRLYLANEVPYELEPVLNYLSQGQNGFVIEDEETDSRSLIINLDIWDCAKVLIMLMSVNTMVLFVLLMARTVYPVLYDDMRKQFVF